MWVDTVLLVEQCLASRSFVSDELCECLLTSESKPLEFVHFLTICIGIIFLESSILWG
jgi:hypothetical protein